MHVYGIFLCFELFKSTVFVEHVLVHGKCWIFLIDSIAFASFLLFHHGQYAARVLCVL